MAAAAPSGAAFAQSSQTATAAPVEEVVVTGSILRTPLSATADPVTTVTAAELDARGITTVTNALQSLAANGSSALPNSFTSNGAFAAGASGVSLRGLTTNSTLVLFDGLRMTYYPLADDGTRGFVDTNTIPDVVIDRVQVDKDGASSTYGADAIAGVVNVITKKTFQGMMLKAEGGWSQAGGGDETNVQALFGKGDLGADGYNFYVGIEYEHDKALYNRDRGYPYNTADQSKTCGTSLSGGTTCRYNGVINGNQYDGSFTSVASTNTAVVRAWDSSTGTAASGYQLLNSSAGCINGSTSVYIKKLSTSLCQQDDTALYGMISPDDKRFSINVHGVRKLWGDAEGYFTFNYYRNDVYSTGASSDARQTSTPGAAGLSYSTSGSPGLTLPVYVCPEGSATHVCSSTDAGAKLNPYNPYASVGEIAQLFYRFGDIQQSTEELNQTFRIATGFHGSFNWMGPWNYAVDLTGSQTDLQVITKGDIYIANLLTAINQGTYNFSDPSANSAAIRNFIAPTNIQNTSSNLAMLQGTLTRELFRLPGGPLQLGLIAAVRYESVDDPSANPDSNGALYRWFTINPFGVVAERSTEGAGFEFDAPIIDQVDVKLSGRYDNYSTGQSHFSPKAGILIHPFKDWAPALDIITVRSSFSQGFRIPSFAESNELATTGFVTLNAPAAFQALHHNDGYGEGYSLGLTTVGTQGLKPETSNNFTGGIVLEPTKHISLSLDFYRIEKKQVIVPNNANLSAALADYFAGTSLPTGYKITAGAVDPNYPTLLALPGFIQYGFINQDKETSSGYDIGAQVRYNLPYGIKWTSTFDGNYMLRLNLFTPDGVEHYAGTIGPYYNVSAAGSPKFKANWSNTFAKGPYSFTVTGYFTDGYQLEAEDFGDTTGNCVSDGATASSINTVYWDGVTPVRCKVKSFWDIQTHLSYDYSKHLQFYVDVDNLFDRRAPYDPTTYGAVDYNDVIANSGIYGRYIKVGARAKF